MPSNAGNFDTVDLYTTGSDGKDSLVTSLSKNFDSHTGTVSVTVPSSVSPGSYFVKSELSSGDVWSGQADLILHRPLVSDSSSEKFNIAATTVVYLPTITGPDSSATWKVGDKVKITWYAQQFSESNFT